MTEVLRYNGCVMKTKTRPMPGRCGRIAILLMLAPLMTLNVSQAMTLCVRGNGNLALELLVEDHCTCEMESPGAPSGGAAVSMASARPGGGWPCLDIPIPTSSCDRRASLAAASGPHCFPGVSGSGPAMVDSSCAMTLALRIFPAPHAPLETILLQV